MELRFTPTKRAVIFTSHPSNSEFCCLAILTLDSSVQPTMPSKFDLTQVVDIFVRVTSGEVEAASSLAPKKKSIKTSPKKPPRTGRAYMSPSNSLSRTVKPESLSPSLPRWLSRL
ncbi:hypothetical protein CRYUN_Cryun05aG0239400 [Craigia yunnanensis]